MLRSLVLAIANNKLIRRIATGGIGRRVALRFVAGEKIDDALAAIRDLNAATSDASIDHLGENISDLVQAKAATVIYLSLLDRIAADGLRSNVSVKLTQMGLDVDPAQAFTNVAAVVARAAEVGTSVTLDMEDHRYTDRTIEAALRLQEQHPGHVGIAVQAYLRRTPEDLQRLTDAGVQIRLCKGAYREPRAIAFRSRDEVNAATKRLATQLLSSGSYAMIATHDEAIAEHALAEARRLGRARDSYELQMLYGVRREMQRAMVARGERLRVYVPFGDEWYPYLTRRIAERPANIRFFLEALLRT